MGATNDRSPAGAPLTVRQAAAELNLSESAIRKMVAAGRLSSYRDGPRAGKLLIPASAIAEHRARLEGASPAPAPPTLAPKDYFTRSSRR
jgi:excisionase family DNA binding protein